MIGRWTVVDAYAEHPDQIDLSPYAYVGNNPIDKTDPDGNCPPCGVVPVAPSSTDPTGGKGIQGAVGTSNEEDPAIKKLPTLKSTQEFADNISDASTDVGLKAGPVVSVVAGPEAGLATMETTGKIGDVSTIVSAGIDAIKGNYGDAVAKTTGVVVSNALGHIVSTKTTSAQVKVVANIVATGVSKLTEKGVKLFNSITSFKANVKSPSKTPTMQRSSIPQPRIPPPPIMKKNN